MSEATQEQPVSTEQPASTEAPAPKLDDVFKEYNVQIPEPSQPQQQPQVQQQPQRQQQAPHLPDPALDPEGFRRVWADREADQTGLRSTLDQVVDKLTRYEQQQLRQREEADIKKAVGFLKEKAPDVDEDMLEIYLGHSARKDPRLLQVWNNRDKNPKAWDAALKALGNEAAGKFVVRADPQLAENQRAMKTAQSHMATAQPELSKTEQIGRMNGAEFDREWERLKSG